eukprot:jgi/Undpi1/5782/HiC_scaffold_2.g01056.m1
MVLFVLAGTGVLVDGQCHHQCSHHGDCNKYGQCECWGGYEGWNCSSLACPSGAAWADRAAGTDDGHNSAVCSSMGYCDGETGLCVCREGFEGRACERMACPNDCSGNGQCLSMAEAAVASDGYRLTRVASYDGWDADMIYGCICDEGYEGYDCSLRLCPVSDSALTSGQQDESAVLFCRCGDDCAKTVGFSDNNTRVCSAEGTTSTITFVRDPGDLLPLYIKFNKLTSINGTEVYMETQATLECQCAGACSGHFRFEGDGGAVTEKLPHNAGGGLMQAALLGLSDLASANITVVTDSASGGACQDSSRVNTSISISLDYGNYPLKVVTSLFDGGEQTEGMTLRTNDGNKERDYCAGLGTCDFSTGQCTCDEGYGYDQDYGPCGQYVFNHSQWPGRQMCPGFVLRPSIDVLPSAQNDWQLYFADSGLNNTNNFTEDKTFDSNILYPGFYWYNLEENDPADSVLFANATNATSDLSNAFALDMTYRVLYYGTRNKVMRVKLPSDLSESDLQAAANGTHDSPVEIFVTLPEDEAAGYLEMDLRPDKRYLYWTVPGNESEADGKVLRKLLANDSDPTFYEDLSDPIRSGMGALGYNLTNPLGIALDLRDHKVSAGVGVLQQVYTSVGVFIAHRPSQAAHNESFSGRRILFPPIYVTIQNTRRRNTLPDQMSFPPSAPRKIACHEKIYFADAQVPGVDGGEDGVIIRCELDGTGVEIAANSNLSDPRALVLDVRQSVMYFTDTHVPSIMKTEMRNYTGDQRVETILKGVTQQRRGAISVESYYQHLLNPQALQFDTREEDLDVLYFSDYDTGYIYEVKTDGSEAEPYLLMGKPKSFIFDLGEGYPTFTLYYDCHGHGVCSGPPYFTCSCDDGFEGNCAQKSCPKGPAWFDEAGFDGSAHAYTECSNHGHCQRDTGVCDCHEGFTGDACQRMECPDNCNGNGKCLSMRQLGLLATDPDSVPSPSTYGSVAGNPLTWDADVVHGCYCDWMGYQGGGPSYTNLSDWTGYDCSRKTCPTGDDSKAARFNTTEFERQNITCTLTDSYGRGENASFSLSFRQGTTGLMAGNSSLLELEGALEGMGTIGDVEVTMSGTGDESAHPSTVLCNSSTGFPASVVFKTELGDLPLLSVATADGVKIHVAEATKGTKLDAECSRHGYCDHREGACVCFEGWATSDGDGAAGHRRDCGWNPGEAGAVY